MKLAKVIGRVVLSKKDGALPNGFLAILSPLQKSAVYGLNAETASAGEPFKLVAYDENGAVPGDIVAYVEGAEATAPFDSPARNKTAAMPQFRCFSGGIFRKRPPERKPAYSAI